MIPGLLLVVLAVVLVVLAARSGRVDRKELRRGLKFVLMAALIVLVGSTLVIGIGLAGKGFFFATLTLADSLRVGLLVGLALGAFILLFGSIFLAVGLLLRWGELWTKTAWLIGPAVTAVAWSLFQHQVGALLIALDPFQANRPQSMAGDMTLTVTRSGEEAQTFALTGICERVPISEQTTIEAGNDAEDERYVAVYVRVGDDGTLRELGVRVAAWAPPNIAMGSDLPGFGQAQLATDAGPMHGSLTFTDAAPFLPPHGPRDPTARWAGTFTWNCDRPL